MRVSNIYEALYRPAYSGICLLNSMNLVEYMNFSKPFNRYLGCMSLKEIYLEKNYCIIIDLYEDVHRCGIETVIFISMFLEVHSYSLILYILV